MNEEMTRQQQEILENLKRMLTNEESVRLFRAFFAGVIMGGKGV